MSRHLEQAMTISTLMAAMQTKLQGMSQEEYTRRLKDIEDREERNRVLWFISQGKCPYCGTKLKRGKKDKNHVRKRWCIKCNIHLSKED